MISKADIEKDILKLDSLYNSETDPVLQLFYSKLAIIELSSWVEDCFDLIAERAIKNRLSTTKHQNLARKTVNNNFGFVYKKNFIPMLGNLAGYEACELLESTLIANGTFITLTSELKLLTDQRNKAAHVGIRKFAYDSPSVTKARFQSLYPIIKGMYSWAVSYCS